MNASERQRNILNNFFRIKTKFQDGKKISISKLMNWNQ